MPQENVEVVRQFFEEVLGFGPLPHWGEHELAAFERWTAAAITYQEDPRWPGADTYRGRDAVREAFLRYFEVFPDMTGKLEDVRTDDEWVVALVFFEGRAATSGVPNEHLWAYLCTVEDGRLASVRAYWDPKEALKAAGLSE